MGPVVRFDGTDHSLHALKHWWTLKCQNKEWLWYLVALIFWRGLTLTIWAWLKAPVVLSSAFILSCFEAYVAKSSGYEFLRGLHDGIVGPTFGFMPIFAFGYVFPFKEVSAMTRDRSSALCAAVAAIYVTIVWMFPYNPLLATGNFYFTNNLLGYGRESAFGQYFFLDKTGCHHLFSFVSNIGTCFLRYTALTKLPHLDWPIYFIHLCSPVRFTRMACSSHSPAADSSLAHNVGTCCRFATALTSGHPDRSGDLVTSSAIAHELGP